MARTIDAAKRVVSGTFGEVWLDGEKVAECKGAQAKLTKNKEKVYLCGQMISDHKVMSMDGTGSLTLYKVDSGMIRKQQGIQDGVDSRFTVVSALKDPDSYGAERVALYNVSFDDLTLMDWQRAAVGEITAPFTFTRYELLDEIEVN